MRACIAPLAHGLQRCMAAIRARTPEQVSAGVMAPCLRVPAR